MKKQDPVDRNHAFELSTQWMQEVCEHVAAWKSAKPSDLLRKPLHSLVKCIVDSCKGAYILTEAEQYDQAGALLRVAIENLWLAELFGSEHPRAEETMKDWIGGKKLKPHSVRKLIAEDFDDDNLERAEYLEFLNAVYAELCAFIHPQAASPSASSFERSLCVVFTSAIGCLLVFISKFQVKIPSELIRRGDTLVAIIPVLLTTHLPDKLRQEVLDFASAMIMIDAETECDYDEK